MAIQKTFETDQKTEGNHWCIKSMGFDADRIIISVDLFISAVAKSNGAVRMITKHYPIPAADLETSTIASLQADCEAWLVANHPDFSGGSLV